MAAPGIPDRVVWAVELIAPTPDDRVLEIGPGPGAAAQLVCERLAAGAGSMLAIDRSATAVDRTRRRNQVHVEAGRLTVDQVALAHLVSDTSSFELVFCVDVNVFWTSDASRELAVVRSLLAPGGTFAILYGPGPRPATPDGTVPDHLRTVVTNLDRVGFVVDGVIVERRGNGVLASWTEPGP